MKNIGGVMEQHWWQQAIVYEIYPWSFIDSNGDGIGDLPGILSKIDYVRSLGVNAIWLGPIYPSPLKDFGYDVTDHTAVDPRFGTMEDFERLLEAVHRYGMKLLLDLIPNHTSDEHPWFEESRSSRDNPKRNWYTWRDPDPNGEPPNNWLSTFGPSAWEWDERTGQYYYHNFDPGEPDLNWHNPEVPAAIQDVMRFWLDKGVDGFRVDALWLLMEDRYLRDNPPDPDWNEEKPVHNRLVPAFSADQPAVYEAIARMREVTDAYEGRVLIGEIYLPPGRLVTYYGRGGDGGVHLPSNLMLTMLSWEAPAIYKTICEYEGTLPEGGWPNWVLGNHDKSRVVSRIGRAQARVAAMLLMTLRGTPTIYCGEEIGMHDVEIPSDRIRDPQFLNDPRTPAREAFRTPMQWNTGPHAGFTTGTPWLPVADDLEDANVAAQEEDPGSLLNLYRHLTVLRQLEPALISGLFRPVGIKDKVFGYTRKGSDGRRFLIVLNFGHEPATFRPDRFVFRGHRVLSTHPAQEEIEVEGSISLRADEGAVILLEE